MRQLFFLLMLSGLFSCRKAADPSPDQDLTLTYQQPTIVTANGAVRATLMKVEDSRCPTGAQCVWAGYAAVAVELTDATSTQMTRISFQIKFLNNYSADSAAVVLNQRPYWLRLLAVNPYPSTKPSNQAQTATLRLRSR